MTFVMFDPEPFYGDDAAVPNPMANNAFGEWLFVVERRLDLGRVLLGILGSLIAGAVAVGLRLRRSTGIEQLQMLWLTWAATLIPLGLLICGTSSWLLGDSLIDQILLPLLLLMQAAVAAAVGVAVARYRLYAIERLINRTLVYAVLTSVLVGTYVAISVGLGVALGRDSAWVTAAATLAVALAFRPLRSRVQDQVDRRFNRPRYDAVRQVQAFEDGVREGRRPPEEIGRVLAEALRDPHAELRFWLPASEGYAGSGGELVEALPDDGRAWTEVERDGARTAVLLHDPALLERRDLLDGVLGAATLSIEDRTAPRRASASARRGRSVSRAHRGSRVRGASSSRARPPRRRAAAAGVARRAGPADAALASGRSADPRSRVRSDRRRHRFGGPRPPTDRGRREAGAARRRSRRRAAAAHGGTLEIESPSGGGTRIEVALPCES